MRERSVAADVPACGGVYATSCGLCLEVQKPKFEHLLSRMENQRTYCMPSHSGDSQSGMI